MAIKFKYAHSFVTPIAVVLSESQLLPNDSSTFSNIYRKISNIRLNKSQNLNDSHLVLQSSFAQSLETMC